MKRRKYILKFWCAFCLLLAVALGIITLIQRWSRIFPSHETSELYSRYENVDGVEASFVKDFRVNDTIAVDVTMLEATDSAGWKRLKEDFDIIEAEDLPPEEREIFNTYYNQSVALKLARPGKYNQIQDTNVRNNDIVACERAEKRVCVFHTANTTSHWNTTNCLYDQMTINNTLNIQSHEEKY